MEKLEQKKKAEPITISEEKGLSRFLASLPAEDAEPPSFFVKVKARAATLLLDLWRYFRSPDFFIWIRNWLKTNLFYLFPASLAAPLMAYCLMRSDMPRLKYLEYGTLDTLWRANLLSLSLILIIGCCQRIVRADKVEVRNNPHPFFRLFWYWVGANFVYILPILIYSSILNAWYFLEGMERFTLIANLVVTLWAIATFFSLLIMSLTAATEWVFQSLGRSKTLEEGEAEENIQLSETEFQKLEITASVADAPDKEVTLVEKTLVVEEVKILDGKADDSKEHST
ncbi:hypothetical protein FAI41_03540 [Acetobacteraceae bacterium]|nr:hypothetical protein FAI41_03540 [Acetobacteraceae bacterium]